MDQHYDVVILGGGLAGLSLSRHLLLDTDKRILLLEKKSELPPRRQKVGESSVQLAGYYFSKVLDLEEYLMHHQFMKYNLRFYWRSGGRSNEGFEDYGHSFIKNFSNIGSYQLDRNTFEGELLRRNLLDKERFTLETSVREIDVELAEAEPSAGNDDAGPHRVRYQADGREVTLTATWVVDTTGRGKRLAKELDLERENTIRHGSFFWWVEGLVDIDKLTGLDKNQNRLRPERRHIGHLPFWLATNHFMDEGMWFWVIPLRGKTSLGIVYDNQLISHDEVFSVDKATRFVCERFPLFARDLPHRKVTDFGGLKSYSHDCAQTLSSARWAMAGEAGRFTDPLYSPGSDLISIYNTLIVDAITTDDAEELRGKCQLYEPLMRAVYQAYVPSYATSYDALGDQECFSLKYSWELAVYFATYVFPFINDLFTERRFNLAFLRHFNSLGPINQGMQSLLSGFYQWKKEHVEKPIEPLYFDFTSFSPLARAEKAFYEVGVDVDEAKRILAEQMESLAEMARFTAAHVAAVVLDNEDVVHNRAFVEGIDVAALDFDPEAFARRFDEVKDSTQRYEWTFDPAMMQRFRTPRKMAAAMA